MRYRPDPITLWCSAGNSMPEIEKDPEKSLALLPCTEESCPDWEDGRCCHVERVGKTGRL